MEKVQMEFSEEQMALAFREAAEDKELNDEFELWDTCIGDGLEEICE